MARIVLQIISHEWKLKNGEKIDLWALAQELKKKKYKISLGDGSAASFLHCNVEGMDVCITAKGKINIRTRKDAMWAGTMYGLGVLLDEFFKKEVKGHLVNPKNNGNKKWK